jgi:hypothetical protein
MANQDERPPQPKRRRHGYRGYGSPLREERGGVIHWGRGFTGVGVAGEDGGVFRPARPATAGSRTR